LASLKEEIVKRPQVGLATLVIQDGKILLGKRISKIADATWAPPGGHLEYGESIEQGAERELLKETGLLAKKITLGPYTNNLIAPTLKHYVTLFVRITEFEGEPKLLEPHKCLGWEWFPLDALPSPLITSFESFLKAHPSFLVKKPV